MGFQSILQTGIKYAPPVAILAILYQNFFHGLIFYALGVGRTYQTIEEFPYTCRRLVHPLLEACEDMQIDSVGRTLYAACSTTSNRDQWSPAANKYNASARNGLDHVSVLNIDSPGADGLYGLHQLSITGNYVASSGGREIDILGIHIETLPNDRLRFWVVNNGISVDLAGVPRDATKVGANSTIEEFHLTRGAKELEFVKTVWSDAIQTPNSVVGTGDGGFLFTNDHGNYKAGALRGLSMLYSPGNVGYCSADSECKIASPTGNYPNGIVRDNDGLVYVAHSAGFKVEVHALQSDNTLVKVHTIWTKMPIDNIRIDDNGDLFVAGFPDVICLGKNVKSPQHIDCPTTIFRIRKLKEGAGHRYELTKALEDIEAKYLPGATVAVHDVQTDKYFLGGVASPYITVCESKAQK